MPSENYLDRSTDSNGPMEQCSRWMDICQKTHTNCQAEDADTPVRVVDTKARGLAGVKYATLSHCWGRKPFINLTPENELLLTTRGIPWHEMPKNFQQAITVARRALDVRYIWIDSLCIIQGPHGDFHSEASLMHAVYRNSHCNLAAADSSDSSGGLFRLRDPRSILPAAYQHHQHPPTTQPRRDIFRQDATYRILPAALWHSALLSAPIYTRGWVFQERLLSPRLLHFTAAQIFWDCGSASACEAFPAGLPAPLDQAAATDRHWRARLRDAAPALLRPLAGPADDSLERFWAAAVRSYTQCALTNGADKLVAVWGIAKLVRDALGEKYGAGLWEERLEEQLPWRVDGDAGWRPRPLRAPSWSWASLDGVVRVGERFSLDRRCYVVEGHGGGAIGFQVVERSGRPALGVRKGSSWSEQFKVWDEQQSEVGERRSSWRIKRQQSGESTVTVTSNASQVTNMGDQQPELDTWSIAILGWVGRLKIASQEGSGKWTVDGLGMDPANPALEVFPDERLPSSVHECYLIVLALSRDGAGIDDADEENCADDEYEEGLDECEEDEDAEIGDDGTGSGGGNSDGRRDDGSLNFKGIDLGTLRRIEESYILMPSSFLDEPHGENGHKFWLE
ncbi:hypothetical protein GTA08_BOTSDO09317 [Neofusicoccum parvum]|uniref:Uncharacterized protein n=1 Tax=Neofusicoccum parvum TaxID=310453 RepID=A0ACB5RUG2_9PEZI|nr:hypothetical protein GTA08_BOTSDO09317 [Neofusicoccum parvum]